MQPWRRTRTQRASQALALLMAAVLLLLAASGCAPVRLSSDAPPPGAPPAIGDQSAWEPTGLAPSFTEKPFWIILALVVLGWIVLAADLPDHFAG